MLTRMTFQFTSDRLILLLKYVKQLTVSRWIIVWTKAVLCIYKCLQIWRHNYVIGCNK